MITAVRQSRLDGRLTELITEEFPGDSLAQAIFAEFLGSIDEELPFLTRLVNVAGARGGRPSWPLRRAATLMIEARLVAAPAGRYDRSEHVLRAIAADPTSGLTDPPGLSVLAEGYSTTEPRRFHAELRRRLARHARVFRLLDGPRTTPEALEDFLALARQDCRLTLARYFFRPHEVARRILELVRTSRGLAAPFASPSAVEAADTFLRRIPPYEQAILRELLAHRLILWVADATSSWINALVEYPLGTVVLVVKPPGSDLEIEIKRAGRRGDRPLSVVFDRGGIDVPPSHRLDGGSMGSNLHAEATSSARFGRLYHLIHGRHAPISVSLDHRSIFEIPCATGRAPLLDYFTEPDVFGLGFAAMRRDMGRAIRSFRNTWRIEGLGLPGDLGLTVKFLSQVTPTQAYLGGSSSFRLDRLAAYLDEGGPELYFESGLGLQPSPSDSRRLAETLLDEVLGAFEPVEVAYRGQAQFVEAVLSSPRNRRRADATFFGLCAEVGRVWGTLFGLRGYADGESFVGRNVGLKSCWESGAWRVRILFMDHDLLSVPRDAFSPRELLRGFRRDAARILGLPGKEHPSILSWLSRIYRVAPTTGGRGRSTLLRAARDASRRARRCLAGDIRVRADFGADCLRDGFDWEAATVAYLRARRDGRDRDAALAALAARLESRGRPAAFIERCINRNAITHLKLRWISVSRFPLRGNPAAPCKN